MRKHRRLEKVSNQIITVSSDFVSPAKIMRALGEQSEIDVQRRAGSYNQGCSERPVLMQGLYERVYERIKTPPASTPPASTPPTPPVSTTPESE